MTSGLIDFFFELEKKNHYFLQANYYFYPATCDVPVCGFQRLFVFRFGSLPSNDLIQYEHG